MVTTFTKYIFLYPVTYLVVQNSKRKRIIDLLPKELTTHLSNQVRNILRNKVMYQNFKKI